MDTAAITVPPRWIQQLRENYIEWEIADHLTCEGPTLPFHATAALANRVTILGAHTLVKVPTSIVVEARGLVMAQMVAECKEQYTFVVGDNQYRGGMLDLIGWIRGCTVGTLVSETLSKDTSMQEFGDALRVLPGFPPSLRMYVSCEYVRTYVRTYIIVFFRIACQKFSLCFVSRVAIIVGQLFLSGGCENAWEENKSTIAYMGNKG
jgi:hypothetical protein